MMRIKMATKFGLALTCAALLVFAITSCDNPTSGGNEINISIFRDGTPAPANIDLRVAPYGGENALRSVQLAARIIPGTAYYQNATWNSSNPAAATVNNVGYVTAVAAGTTTITATTAAGHPASVTIRVRGYEPDTEPGEWSEHAGNLIILHAAAVAALDGNAHRTFVELFNRSSEPIYLGDLSLQYALGQGNEWEVISLPSEYIPAGHSFLILGTIAGLNSRLQLPDGDADKLLPNFQLNNRAFRLALMEGVAPLTVHNPSDLSQGAIDLRLNMPAANAGPSTATVGAEIAAGLIDMLGVVNTRTSDNDIIHGAKGAPAYRISNQTSIRRANLNYATNNFNDFRGIDWQTREGAVADDQIAVFTPRNLTAGVWTPEFPEPNWTPPPVEGVEIQRLGSTITALQLFVGGPTVQLTAQVTPPRPDEAVTWSVEGAAVTISDAGLVTIVGEGTATITATIDGESENVEVTVSPQPAQGTERLLILQANRSGNANGLAGGFPRALVELFNNTDEPIDLAAGNFSLHTGNATDWQHFVPLAGIIPARSSFLIVSNMDSNTFLDHAGNPRGRAELPAADMYADFDMGAANNWRVAIMTNQSALLAVNNPFGYADLANDYVDMLGTGNATASEYQSVSTSQPQGPRRTSLVDTDNNSADFAQTDFRGHWEGTARMPNADLYRFWPRNSGAGEWNPMTGNPAIHPAVRHPTTGAAEFPVGWSAPSTGDQTTVNAAAGRAQNAVNAIPATNETTEADITAAVVAAIDNANIAVTWTGTFTLIPTAVGTPGSITGTITLALNGVTATVTVKLTIPELISGTPFTIIWNGFANPLLNNGAVTITGNAAAGIITLDFPDDLLTDIEWHHGQTPIGTGEATLEMASIPRLVTVRARANDSDRMYSVIIDTVAGEIFR